MTGRTQHTPSRINRRWNPIRRCAGAWCAGSALRAAGAAVLAFFAFSCSSAPKRPAEVFTDRNAAVAQIELGNASVSKGDYANAHLFLQEAWRLAVSADDPDTRVRVLLAEGNAYFNEGKRDKAQELWTHAENEAREAGNATLESTSKIYRARGTLAEGLGADAVSDAERKRLAREAKTVTVREMPNIKSNPLFTAFAWKVIGLAEKEEGNAAAAEKAILEAAAIHEKNRYLEDAAYDWYLIASVRSRAFNYPAAREALRKAIQFDRRAENANGLGMNWLALGTVEEKAGDIAAAIAAYTRAADIFSAAFLKAEAAAAAGKARALKDIDS